MSRVARVALFGASERGRQCLQQLRNVDGLDVVLFLDNSPARWGTLWHDLPVERPSAEACASVDLIVIATVHAGEVFAQLRRLGVGRKVALSPADVLRRVGGVQARAAGSPASPGDEGGVSDASPDVNALADALGRTSAPREPFAQDAACTICCNNYLAFAKVLADSYLQHHPDHRFFIALADRLRADVAYPVDPRIEVVTADAIAVDGLDVLAFRYRTIEFTTAIKPFLLRFLFESRAVRRLLYLDPDILVCTPLRGMFDSLAEHGIALVPHILTPLEDDRSPSEIDLLRAGTFNLGVIGVARMPETIQFLDWWARRLRLHCTTEVEKGLFTDQKWIDLVPSLFPDHVILRDPGLDVAYWNLHERRVALHGDALRAGEGPLRFFHFSGLDVADLDAISRHQNRHRLPVDGPLRLLFEAYRVLLLRAGHVTLSQHEPHYTRFDDGTPIPTMARQVYRQPDIAARFPHPFRAGGSDSFLAWLLAPARPGGELSRLLAGIHALSPDLQRTFPDPHGRDELDFIAYMAAAADLYGLHAVFLEPVLPFEGSP